MSNKYYVKPEAKLTLEIKDCSPATKEALERHAALEEMSVAEYCANAVLAELQMDEDAFWDNMDYREKKEKEAKAAK